MHNHDLNHVLKQHTDEAINELRTRLANNVLDDDDFAKLGSDAGIDIGEVRCWIVDGEIRTYTSCLSCDRYYEEAVKIDEVTA